MANYINKINVDGITYDITCTTTAPYVRNNLFTTKTVSGSVSNIPANGDKVCSWNFYTSISGTRTHIACLLSYSSGNNKAFFVRIEETSGTLHNRSTSAISSTSYSVTALLSQSPSHY